MVKSVFFSMKWTERESVWPEKSIILVIFFENCNFTGKFDIFSVFHYFHENCNFSSKEAKR